MFSLQYRFTIIFSPAPRRQVGDQTLWRLPFCLGYLLGEMATDEVTRHYLAQFRVLLPTELTSVLATRRENAAGR